MQSAVFASSFTSLAADVAARKPPATSIEIPGVKPASALEVRPAPEMVPFGIAALDELTGGVPRGALTEMVGPASSGRTSVTMSLMAEVTRRQEVCAVIDATDSFDPVSAEAAGVDLKRVLWVRCGKNSGQQTVNSGQRQKVNRAQQTVNSEKQSQPSSSPSFQANAQSESNTQKVHQAITSGCFEAARGRREPSTMNNVAPPAKNISWSIHENYDARLRHAMMNGGETRESWSGTQIREARKTEHVPTRGSWSVNRGAKGSPIRRNFEEIRRAKWNRLDQALKATDLLIQSGGFGLIVIDLGDISPEQARRIPLTSWFRFRRAVENTPTILLLVARDSCAKTCASLVMQLGAEPKKSGQGTVDRGQKQWGMASGECLEKNKESGIRSRESAKNHGSVSIMQRSLAHVCLLDGLRVQVELLRTRLERKPVRSAKAQLETRTLWKRSG
jgi:recombination protein RecA